MKYKYKVKYVVVTKTNEKILYVITEHITYDKLLNIGPRLQELIKLYQNCNVLFKLMDE